jgi:hypothetical protein
MSSLFADIDLLISEAICTETLGTLAVLRIASSFMEPSIYLADLGGFQSPETLTYNYYQWLSELVTQYWFSIYYGSWIDIYTNALTSPLESRPSEHMHLSHSLMHTLNQKGGRMLGTGAQGI